MTTDTHIRIHYTYTSLKGVEKKTYFSAIFPIQISVEEAIRMVKERGVGINPTFVKITRK